MPDNKTENKIESKKDEKSIEDIRHDMRGALSVMLMNIELFVMSSEYKEGGEKVEKFVKMMNKQISVLTQKLKHAENKS